MKHVILILVTLLWSPSPADADPSAMSQNEFRTLIEGNSIVGEWAGRPYRQFFDAHGRTTYVEKGAAATFGTWRIAEDGRYCSVWPPSPQESCYSVQRDGDTLFWDAGGGKVYSSQVVPGQQLDW